ncbi:MAG: helix-turn-helix transcriptional regulator, partial [Eubacteriales bacterium]|nr:helix-turn-helix transcriptional regulator [Eubacteriales bacterium]
MEKTGSYIKEICKKNGIRAKDIKNRLCMSSVQSVYDWFHGKTLPSVDNLL